MTGHRLECMVCGRVFAPKEVDYVCPDHGDDGVLDVVYDYDELSQRIDRNRIALETMWSYRSLLPVPVEAEPPPLRVGATPLYASPLLARRSGVRQLWVKDEGVQPTGSLKDRASAMALVKADELGSAVVTTASTGNAAAALAGLAASVGRETVIFVPAAAPQAKLAQLLAYGSRVLLVAGSYNDAIELCLRASERFGWYNRTTGYNPYMSEGKKTVAYEVAHQLGWQSPDVVVVSVGDGCIIGALWKGFHDLIELGWLNRMPRLLGIQAAGSNYLAQAWSADEDVLTKPPIEPDTVADSISAALPRDRLKAMRAVRESDGGFFTVTDDEILGAIPVLAGTTGVFAEPAAAAAWAGVERAGDLGLIGTDDRVVVLATGTGLKDVPAAMSAVEGAGLAPLHVAADPGLIEETLEVLQR